MLNRKELKSKGKAAFKNNYWACVVVALIIGLATYGGSVGVETKYTYVNGYEQVTQYLTLYGFAVSKATAFNVASSGLIAVLLGVFVFSVFEVGACAFFKKNRVEKADFEEVFLGFNKQNYKNIVFVHIIKNIKLFVAYLLLIIPGIIKTYEYYMIPYILSENPTIDQQDAFRKSKDMMDGHKWEVFVFEFSFILWHLLSSLTFGLLNIFYVNPYIQASRAEVYNELKNKIIENNENMNESSQLIHMDEL